MSNTRWQDLQGKQRERLPSDVARVERAKEEYQRRVQQIDKQKPTQGTGRPSQPLKDGRS